MATKTTPEEIQRKKADRIKNLLRAALGGASFGTMIVTAFATYPLWIITGALVGAAISTKLTAEVNDLLDETLDEKEDNSNDKI